ncbi:MAG: hypothetical protein M0T82_07585 [Desulfobacteraceae bacterium]|nr:hypothetical protein [Desulfobacteraceae bacterium]
MNKKITSDNPILILTVATSSGEIDWILPVLTLFLKKKADWRLITVFGHKSIFDRIKHTNQKLFREFMSVSSLNIVPQEIDTLFSKEINSERVKIIFKDFNNDEFAPFKTQIEKHCSDALLVSYPHSSYIYSVMGKDPISICQNPDAYSKHDIFLLGSENDIPYWSEFVNTKKIRTLGTPRYDSWWLKNFIEDPDLTSSEEFQKAQKADKVFFWIGRGVHPHYLSRNDYEYLLKSMADVIFSYNNPLLIIKPHPRQDIDELFKLLSTYDHNRYLVSGLHLLQLSHISDVVISAWSSGALDALAMKKPVIEFWRFGGRDPLCRKTLGGNYTTIYRELGLVAAADTREDLDSLLQFALKDPHNPVWTSQVEAFNRICKSTDQVSEKIVKTLEEELVKRSDLKTVPIIQTDGNDQAELIEKMIEFITSLVEMGLNKRAKLWLDFLEDQFPDNVRILNNVGIFLFNQGDVNPAVDRLVKCIDLSPSYYEAIVNLIQILLITERAADAIEIVVSYYLKTPEEEKKKFLQALAEQLTEQQFMLIHHRILQIRI